MNSNPFPFKIIDVKILFSFKKELLCTFGRKKNTFEKNNDCPFSKFECCGHAKTFFIFFKL